MELFKNWEFFIPQYEKIRKGRRSKNKLAKLKVLKIGHENNSFYTLDPNSPEHFLTFDNAVREEFEKTFDYGFKTPENEWHFVRSLGIGPTADLDLLIEEFIKANELREHRISQGEKRLKPGEGYRSYDKVRAFYKEMINSGFKIENNICYYYSAHCESNIEAKTVETKPRLHYFKTKNITEDQVALLLKSMQHPYLKNGDLATIPLMIKILRSHHF